MRYPRHEHRQARVSHVWAARPQPSFAFVLLLQTDGLGKLDRPRHREGTTSDHHPPVEARTACLSLEHLRLQEALANDREQNCENDDKHEVQSCVPAGARSAVRLFSVSLAYHRDQGKIVSKFKQEVKFLGENFSLPREVGTQKPRENHQWERSQTIETRTPPFPQS